MNSSHYSISNKFKTKVLKIQNLIQEIDNLISTLI